MRVFLDTNVLASALATRGLCADVLREILTYHELVVCESVLRELHRTLKNKFGTSRKLADEIEQFLRQDTILAQPAKAPQVRLKDKDDLVILSCALNAKAELLVTGDKELHALGAVEKLRIVSPRQFWEKLSAGSRTRRHGGKRPK